MCVLTEIRRDLPVKKGKRIVSLLLALALMAGQLPPVRVWAEETVTSATKGYTLDQPVWSLMDKTGKVSVEAGWTLVLKRAS